MWTPLPGMGASGTVLLRAPAASTVVTFVASTTPLAPRVVDRSGEDVFVAMAEVDAAERRAAFGASAGVDARFAYRIDVTGPGSVIVALGGVPIDVVARAEGDAAATISDVDTADLLRRGDRSTDILGMARDDQMQLVGPGWSEVVVDDVGPFRWTVAERASLLLPLTTGAARKLRLQARLAPSLAVLDVRVRLNGRDLGAQPVVPRWRIYEWDIPAGASVAGTNVMTLAFGDDSAVTPVGRPTQRLAVGDVRVLYDVSSATGGAASAEAPLRPCS
jgi:hypothetical protein